MGRNRRRGWASRLVRVIASLAAICVSCAGGTTALPGEREAAATSTIPGLDSASSVWGAAPNAPAPACPSSGNSPDHFLLMVSTIDGAVSALDMRDKGQILWSVKPDDRPLLSSSISNIQVTKDGVPTRLIPSLDGGLYEFNGEEVKEMPMTAETLLSSSIRLSDNYVMVGGKDVGSYGIDLETGQMLYKCTTAGCSETSEAGNGNGDMMVITRNLKTVRAVDVNSGSEKWNFSVGQHDLLFVESKKEKPGLEQGDTLEFSDEDVTLVNCTPSDDETRRLDEEELKQMIKVLVSDGQVFGLKREDPSQISWSTKFSSPVAKAWILHHGKLEVVSLFDTKIVPALSSGGQPHHFFRGDPLLYVGTHQRQVYVQTQEAGPDSCKQDVPWSRSQNARLDEIDSMPRVSWRPYIMRNKDQTPIFGGNIPPEVPLLGQQHNNADERDSDTALTVWNEDYPFDMGYYLYPYQSEKKQPAGGWQAPPDGILDVLPASLWVWWKEVVAISLLTSLFVHIILTRCIHRHPRIIVVTESNSQGLETKESSGSLMSNNSLPTLEQLPADFKSRFAEEFECMEQLGKGGFGIVFRAKNKVDEQEYAVKRIALPNSDDGAIKKKMLREVRTLAMLDHIGIVRYFHSWIEDPPLGWQEDRDKEVWDTVGTWDCATPTADTTVASIDATHTSVSPGIPFEHHKKLVKQRSVLDEIMPIGAGGFEDDSQLFSKGLKSSGSGEFSVHSNVEVFTDESGSFSFDGDKRQRVIDCEESKDSYSVNEYESDESSDIRDIADAEFSTGGKTEDVSNSGWSDSVIPFKRYSTGKSENCDEHMSSSKPEDEEDSVVFEASYGGENKDESKDVSIPADQSSSVVFADSSYGGSVGDNESGDHLKNNHRLIKFTLSSQGYSEHSKSEEQQVEKKKKDKTMKEKKTVPKLYLYLQMQLCRLETLKDWLIDNTLNRERAVILDIFEQIVSAVDYVHAKGLIHRDLKPSNIFFALDGIVKVGDFGLVTAAENQAEFESTEHSPDKKASAKHTAEVGTQLYMSPEQVQKKAYDQKVDVFSLGLIFLELLMPFSTAMERVSTLQNARKGIFPERFCRELPVESDLVRQLTSVKPQTRPTTQQILNHSLLKDFVPRRLNFLARSRTISGSSAHSVSEPVLSSDTAVIQPSGQVF
ncbi:eukaryotic translation initiation factor 2-alpha kinase 3-like [Littorina saxatilis]|uniref:non-specific serine/threonine protein kinase n=1 Tax=Littorina saxatilis TaxID=31220 RepID=A0AAN9BSM6_9CAEN